MVRHSFFSFRPFSGHTHRVIGFMIITVAMVFAVCRFAAAEARPIGTSTRSFSEYEIKAGFIYRFIFFVSWPEDSLNEKIKIGIYGENPFGDAFDEIDGTTIDGRTVDVVYFERDSDREDLRNCQLLFVGNLSGNSLRSLLASLSGSPVLTIGDGGAFVDQGGMLGFVDQDNRRIGVEINVRAATRSGLTIGSMLKRIAGRIIEESHHNQSFRYANI